MPRKRLRHFLLHSILFHIFLGAVITIALIYLFDKETGVGGGQTGGRLEPIIVSVIDESDMPGSTSNEAEQAPQPDEEKEDSSEQSVILEKIPERTEEAIKKVPEIKTVSVPKKPAEQSERKEPSENKSESDAVATSEAGETGSPAEGDDAEREAPEETAGELAYNLNEGAKPNYGINPKPPYPKSARRRGQEGTVLLRVLVLEDGKVGDIELAGPSGYSVLDESALKAVKDWVFIPGKQGGKDISSWVEVPIKFRLDSG